jgi:rhodanese-related sulfurtransferase
MSAVLLAPSLLAVLERARAAAQRVGLGYPGSVTPRDAWTLAQSGQAALSDVRSPEERYFVGHVPGSVHVPFAMGIQLERNPDFIGALELLAGKDDLLLLLDRAGKRSVLAAEAAQRAGFTNAFNVLEGFEGNLDANQRRGTVDGWRFHQLPWQQD